MKKKLFGLLTTCAMLLAGSAVGQHTFVLVHGAWGGGWSFKKTDELLRKTGHTVYRPTLTGLGERAHLISSQVDLQTHIQDVINTILFEDLHNVVLLGHSYGGMVVTGVADSLPDRISRLVYLDAFVPEDGQSASTAHGHGRTGREIAAGDSVIRPAWVRPGQPLPHDVPHPVKTFTQPIQLKNPKRMAIPTTYILTYEGDDPETDGFAFFARRAADYGWPVVRMQADHNPQMTMPDRLAVLLEQVAAGGVPTGSLGSDAGTDVHP